MSASHAVLRSYSSTVRRKTKKPAKQSKRFTLRYLPLAVSAALGTATFNTFAGPEGGVIRGGAGSINQSGKNTTVTQTTDRMAIDWNSFDIKSDERVQFIQPDSQSVF